MVRPGLAPTRSLRWPRFDRCVHSTGESAFHRQGESLLRALVAEYGSEAVTVVFHRHRQKTFMRLCASLGLDSLEISGGAEGFEHFDRVGLHVGYRVHAHLYCLSHETPSYLIAEDSRGLGMLETLGRLGTDGFGNGPSLVAEWLWRDLPRLGSDRSGLTRRLGLGIATFARLPDVAGLLLAQILDDRASDHGRHVQAKTIIRDTVPADDRHVAVDTVSSPVGPVQSVLIVIPARGGSKGIPRKNLRSMRGRPLVAYAIDAALRSSHHPTVVITSEDDEILSVGEALGAVPHRRPVELAGDAVALDAVVHDAYRGAVERFQRDFQIVVTVQPTSPLLRTATLDRAIEALTADPGLDTVLTAVEDTHLRWSLQDDRLRPAYEARLNRQYLPKTFKETGGAVATRSAVLSPTDRIGRAVSLIVVDAREGIDIDGPEDWALCEWHLSRREVLFVVIGNPEVGLGHAHNALAVADTLTRHRVRFLVDRSSALAAQVIRARNYEVVVQSRENLADDADALSPDLVINDCLDTTESYVTALKRPGRLVVNFEDLGPGALHADLVINAIYPERELHPKHYFGPRYYCPRPEFVVSNAAAARDPVREVLVTFGGTDPNNLTARVAHTDQADRQKKWHPRSRGPRPWVPP